SDPHPPRERRLRSLRVLLAALGMVLAAALFFWIRNRLRRFREDHAEALLAPAGTPEDRALSALAGLASQGPGAKGQTRAACFPRWEIVRRYLEETSIPGALDMTAEELAQALENRPPPGLDRARFTAWLARGDWVRYARLVPDADAASADILEAR